MIPVPKGIGIALRVVEYHFTCSLRPWKRGEGRALSWAIDETFSQREAHEIAALRRPEAPLLDGRKALVVIGRIAQLQACSGFYVPTIVDDLGQTNLHGNTIPGARK